MKKLTTALCVAAIFALIASAPSAHALTVKSQIVAATSTAGAVTFTTPVSVLDIRNEGTLYAAWLDWSGATATTSLATSIKLGPCEGKRITFPRSGPTNLSIITAAGTTTTVRAEGYTSTNVPAFGATIIESLPNTAACTAPLTDTAAVPVSVMRTFTESTGAGIYTGSVTVPAGALIVDIKVWSTALWTATTSATMKVGDVADDDGWFTAVDLEATDLLVGEELNFVQAGGKQGAYLSTTTGLRSAAYNAGSVIVSGIITTVGAAGSAGRTFMAVTYVLPSSAAAGKV